MLSTTALQVVNRAKFLLNDNSVVILTGAAVVGTAATAVLTGRATFKAAEIIQKEKEDLQLEIEFPTEEDVYISKTEKFKLVWPQYVPPVAMGVATIACIVTANRITSKKIAALVVASGVSERALSEYKAKVLEKLGERQETAIRDEIAQDRVTNNPPSQQVIIAGSGDVLCFEPLTGRYFTSTVEDIKRAENKVNFEILHYDSCSLSHFFEEIGLPPTTYSDLVGWNVSIRPEVTFSTTMSEDKRPCLVLSFNHMPTMEYDKSWT